MSQSNLTIEEVLMAKNRFENHILFSALFLNLTWYLIRCIGALTIPEFYPIYAKLFLKDTLYFVFVLSGIPILKLMSRGFKENFATIQLQEKKGVEILAHRFQPHFLVISLLIFLYIFYNYVYDYFNRLVSFPKYLGLWGFISQLAYVFIFLTAFLFFSHFFVQLFFLNKAMPYIKIDLFHEDGFCGFQKMGKYFLKIAIVLFILISMVVLYSIFSTARKTVEYRIWITVFSIVVTFPIVFAAFFYPQTGIKKAIEKQKNDLLHQISPLLPQNPILTLESLKSEEINLKLYNWAVYQRLEKVKLFQYDPDTIKKLLYAGLSPIISGVLGLILSMIM